MLLTKKGPIYFLYFSYGMCDYSPMFSHADIWIAIDHLAKSSGYSTSGLARKAGLDPTTFNKSKRMSPAGKPRWPSTESLAKILAVTNVTMDDFITLITVETRIDPSPDIGRVMPRIIPQIMPETAIPVIAFSQITSEHLFDEAGYPIGNQWGHMELPGIAPTDPSIYAIDIDETIMSSMYREGDIMIVSPAAPINRGNRAMACTTDGYLLIGEMSRRTSSFIELQPMDFDSDHYDAAIELGTSDIQWIARILWVSQ